MDITIWGVIMKYYFILAMGFMQLAQLQGAYRKLEDLTYSELCQLTRIRRQSSLLFAIYTCTHLPPARAEVIMGDSNYLSERIIPFIDGVTEGINYESGDVCVSPEKAIMKRKDQAPGCAALYVAFMKRKEELEKQRKEKLITQQREEARAHAKLLADIKDDIAGKSRGDQKPKGDH